MPSLRQTSKPANKRASFLPALIVALVAATAVPAAGQAAPPEPGEPPQLAFEPAAHDFGLQGVEWGAQQTTFQLRNNGAEPVSTEHVELVGPGTEAFWTGYSDCAWRILQPNETCSTQVYFSPRDAVDYTAQLRVYASSHPFVADLSGEGGHAAFAPASNPVDFGATPVGSAGVTREIEIANVGNMPGGVFIAVISGGAVGSFQLLDENCTGVPLAPAATCTAQVRFRPLSEGAKKATLSLFGDGDGGAQVILIGMGSAPAPTAGELPTPEGPAASPGAVTSIVNTTTHRVTRTRVKPQRARPKRNRGYRSHRRASIASARVSAAPSGRPPGG